MIFEKESRDTSVELRTKVPCIIALAITLFFVELFLDTIDDKYVGGFSWTSGLYVQPRLIWFVFPYVGRIQEPWSWRIGFRYLRRYTWKIQNYKLFIPLKHIMLSNVIL